MKVIVLGAGLVGVPMALDLAKDPRIEVCTADIQEASLARLSKTRAVSTLQEDLSDAACIRKIVSGFDMVINALPGRIGFQTLKSVIEAGKNVVDIAFFPEDPFDLDKLAKEKEVTAVVDCGVSPGMSNVLAGYASNLLDKTDIISLYVGGLPEKKAGPLEFKALFSLSDLLEVYTRPARVMENGVIVTKAALSDLEQIDFADVGPLEAFCTDGLRTLIKTIDCPNMKEKTLRYPGHIEKIQFLIDCGLLSHDTVDLDGAELRPIDLTAKVLSHVMRLEPGEKDITVMRLIVEGRKDQKKIRYTFELLDKYDETTGVHSMGRTTGYAAAAVARMIASGIYTQKGISPPEYIGRKKECVDFLLKEMSDRRVIYTESLEETEC